jgi:hypothetical protein
LANLLAAGVPLSRALSILTHEASQAAAKKQWAYAEWGTGPLGAQTATNPPAFMKRRGTMKFPPWRGPLAAWARSRGLNPFLVAKGIFERQGVRAKPYFTPVIEWHKDRILDEVRKAVEGSVPAHINQGDQGQSGVTVAVGGASFDSTEMGWAG